MSVPALICGIIITSLKVMCMQFDMYLALASSPPDKLMGPDPSCQGPIIKPQEWPALKSIPSQAASFLLGLSSRHSFWVLFSPVSAFCLPSCSFLSFINHFSIIPPLVRFCPFTHQLSLSVLWLDCLVCVIFFLLLCSS